MSQILSLKQSPQSVHQALTGDTFGWLAFVAFVIGLPPPAAAPRDSDFQKSVGR
jgi:hypothetical protein